MWAATAMAIDTREGSPRDCLISVAMKRRRLQGDADKYRAVAEVQTMRQGCCASKEDVRQRVGVNVVLEMFWRCVEAGCR